MAIYVNQLGFYTNDKKHATISGCKGYELINQDGQVVLKNEVDYLTLDVILDIHKTKGYMFDPLEVANGDLFFQKTELQDFFVALWEEMARRYGQYKDYVAFELLNEVVNPAVDKIWNGIAKRTIEAIRAIVPDVYILVGGVCYNSVSCVSRLDDPYDDKIVYNFHCYEPLVFTHQAAYWVVDMPADIHATFEKYGIGRAVWNYKQKDFGIVDPHYEEILDEVVKNL